VPCPYLSLPPAYPPNLTIILSTRVSICNLCFFFLCANLFSGVSPVGSSSPFFPPFRFLSFSPRQRRRRFFFFCFARWILPTSQNSIIPLQKMRQSYYYTVVINSSYCRPLTHSLTHSLNTDPFSSTLAHFFPSFLFFPLALSQILW